MQINTRGYAHTISIAADPAMAWQACTQADWLARWYATEVLIEARRGGRWRMVRKDGTTCEAVIDVFDVGRRLRLIYVKPPFVSCPPDLAPIVDDLMFDADAHGAVVRVLGSGVPALPSWDKAWMGLRKSWIYSLAELKTAVESQVSAQRLPRS